MPSTKLFERAFVFQNATWVVIGIPKDNTKFEIMVNAGDRGDDFDLALRHGPDPNGGIVKGAVAVVPNDTKPVDVTWVIPNAGTYVFVLHRNQGDLSKPPKTVKTTVWVWCNPAGKLVPTPHLGPLSEIPDPHATPVTDPDNVKPNIVHGSGSSTSGGSSSGGSKGSGTAGSGSGATPGGPGPADPTSGPDKPDTSGAGNLGNNAPTTGAAGGSSQGAPQSDTATPAGTTVGTTATTGAPADAAPAPAAPDEANTNLTVPDNAPAQQPSQIPTSPGGPATVPKAAPTPDADTPVAPTPTTPEPDSTLVAGSGGGPAPTDPSGAGNPAPGGPTPGDSTGGPSGPPPADPAGDGPPPPDPTTGDPPPPPPPEFPADWVTLVPDLLAATAIAHLGVGPGSSVLHLSAGARSMVAERAQSALASAAAGAAAQVHIHEHAHQGSHHGASRTSGAAARMAFAYVLPGHAAQGIRLREPKTGAVREVAVPPNGALVYRAELERGAAAAGQDAHAWLHGVLAGGAS